jgi:hypothetical protein
MTRRTLSQMSDLSDFTHDPNKPPGLESGASASAGHHKQTTKHVANDPQQITSLGTDPVIPCLICR